MIKIACSLKDEMHLCMKYMLLHKKYVAS